MHHHKRLVTYILLASLCTLSGCIFPDGGYEHGDRHDEGRGHRDHRDDNDRRNDRDSDDDRRGGSERRFTY